MREALKTARRAQELTQDDLAKAVGIDRTAYCRIENGNQKPSVDVAIRIARHLKLRVEDLFLPTDVQNLHVINTEQAAARSA